MASTQFHNRHHSTTWWMAIVAPLMGVPAIVALLTLAAQVPEVAPFPVEEPQHPEAVVEFVDIGGDEPLPCTEKAPRALTSGDRKDEHHGNDRLLLPT